MPLQIILAAAALLSNMQPLPRAANREADVRNAVTRSLPFLEKEGVAWLQQKNCASCHHVPFLLWSHNAARTHGINVSNSEVAKWTDWTWQFSRTRRAWFKLTSQSSANSSSPSLPAHVVDRLKTGIDKPFAAEKDFVAELRQALGSAEAEQYRNVLIDLARRPTEPENDGGGLDTLAQMLLGRDRSKNGKSDSAFVEEIAGEILRWQRADGSWQAAGQLPQLNRPREESDRVTTMWTLLALGSIRGERPGSPISEAIRRSRQWLTSVKPGETNESLLCCLLVERLYGDKKKAAGLLQQLIQQQNPDGGWAWRQGGPSDAFATGQALYALGVYGSAGRGEVVHRAQNYLIGSQGSDGSWMVPGGAISSAKTEARLAKVEPIYRYWGTAWASIGLSATLPSTHPAVMPRSEGGSTRPLLGR
jgi:hypothetical protein